jgi:AcrR family transcriptional regulator
MITAARAQDTKARKLRADRIMDAASELLLRWGYKRVTIDDVAEHAGIGKGTIYLHYRTREELFYSVIMREQANATAELIEALRKDPREALLHRLVRLKFLTMMRRPILKALVAADPEILGRLVNSADTADLGRLQGLISSDYFKLLIDNGLIRPGLSVPELFYAVGAVTLGFFAGDAFLEAFGEGPELERRADLLESAVERAFSLPASDEVLRKIAPAVVELYEKTREISQAYLQRAYEAKETRHGGSSP